MKKVVLILLTAVLLMAFTKDWQTYTDPKKVFTVQFPDVPKTTVQDIPTKAGIVKAHQASYSAASETESNKKYLVSMAPLPPERVRTTEASYALLSRSVEGSVRNHKAMLVSSVKTTFKGHLAIDTEMTMKDGSIIIKSRTLLINDNHIGLIVYTPVINKGNSDVTRFLGSFKLLKK